MDTKNTHYLLISRRWNNGKPYRRIHVRHKQYKERSTRLADRWPDRGDSDAAICTPTGKRTRTQIRQEGIQLRDRTTTEIKKAADQVRSETERITTEVREKVGELKQLGQDKLVEQMEHMSAALDTGKTAVEAA